MNAPQPGRIEAVTPPGEPADDGGSANPPPLARHVVDRAAHRRSDPRWLADAWAGARVLVVDTAAGGVAAFRDGPGGPALVLVPSGQAPPVPPDRRLFLGVAGDGTPVFAVDAPLDPPAGARTANLREIGHLLGDEDAGVLTEALALAHWHVRHAYSPATGEPTTVAEGGWVRLEPGGGQLWPRTDPAVITLVHDGVAGPDGRCLLGHNGLWRQPATRRFSCLAGFVEAGESAEAAVAREIREEVGVEVDRLRYVGSQAWPFPGSLMLGFMARADPTQPIRVDADEIVDARWFSRREIGDVYGGRRVELDDGAELVLPFGSSIASYLIATWSRQESRP